MTFYGYILENDEIYEIQTDHYIDSNFGKYISYKYLHSLSWCGQALVGVDIFSTYEETDEEFNRREFK